MGTQLADSRRAVRCVGCSAMRRARFFVGGEPAAELTECLLVQQHHAESHHREPPAGDGAGYEPPVMDGYFDGMVIMSAWNDDSAADAVPERALAPPAPDLAPEPAPAVQPGFRSEPEPEPEPEPPAAEAPPSCTQTRAGQANTVRMVVPSGAKAGEIVTLETEQGDKISMALPAGATAGATIQFKVQQSFWDKADAAVGKLGAAAMGMLSNFLTGAEAPDTPVPPREERQAQVRRLAAGTLLCVPGCTRLRRLEGASQLPLAAGELEIFATPDRASICFNVRPEVKDDEDALASSEQLMKGLVGNIPSSAPNFDQHGKQMPPKKASKRPKKKEGQPPTLEEQAAVMKATLAVALAEHVVEEQKARDAVELTTVTLRRKVGSGGLGMVISDSGRVIAVGSGTPASEAGVVPGSRIRAVARCETKGKAEIIAAIQQQQQQQQEEEEEVAAAPLELSIALPPPPCTATLRLWEKNTDAVVLEVESGEFHFLCSDRSQAVCVVLPAGARTHGVCEELRQVLTKWLGPTGLLTRFGLAARDAALAKSKAELAPAATVRKGLFSMMKAADLVISTARAAEHGVSQSGGGLLKGAMAGMNAVSTVRQQQELDPLRRLLPLDWAELPIEMEGAMTLIEPSVPGAAGGGAAGGNRVPCYGCLKLRSHAAGKQVEGWLVHTPLNKSFIFSLVYTHTLKRRMHRSRSCSTRRAPLLGK